MSTPHRETVARQYSKITLCSLLCLFLLFFATSCKHDKGAAAGESATDTTFTEGAALPAEMQGKDSTVYGRADGFGQSALTLIANDGRELDLSLTAKSPAEGADRYAKVYGDREDTARYAAIVCDGGEAVSVLINLSQLERYLKTYAIHNGQLFVPNEGGALQREEIMQLDDKVLMTRDDQGSIHRWRR